MTAEGAIDFEALEAQAARLMRLFVEAGYERVAPAFIQPADIFLDRIGETLRARTYVFIDPNGEELCLRPDLTIPVCRVFLERGGKGQVAKFCYNGPAFRIQEGKPDPLRPREFRQAGIECFGPGGEEADLEVLALTVDAVRRAGVSGFTVKVGHIGIFAALLAALDIPARWRDRLARAFWRPHVFASELSTLSQSRRGAPLIAADADLTCRELLERLEASGIPFIGLRRPFEIVTRLRHKAADASEPPIPPETRQFIESYLAIGGDITPALDAVGLHFAKAGFALPSVVGEAARLFERLQVQVGPLPITFEGGFGRHFEYYTGMVFQIKIDGAGIAGEIAGGGRYDGLIAALSGGERNVPAVGAAVHTERLLAASRG